MNAKTKELLTLFEDYGNACYENDDDKVVFVRREFLQLLNTYEFIFKIPSNEDEL